MDVIPRPDQVVSAAGNVAVKVLRGGLADLRPMPRTLVDEGTLREVYHYRAAATVLEQGDPVLLVSPLAAPATCYDLRRGCSLAEHFVRGGRPTYLVEYGDVPFRDRDLDLAPWVDDVVPAAVRAASAHAGGRPVHVVGWSLGGIFSLLAVAGDADLPVASLSVLGSPVDVSQVPMVAPIRPLVDLTEGTSLTARVARAVGVPAPLRWAVELSAFQSLVTKPVAVAARIDDREFLAQLEAVDRFRAGMTAYRGRAYGQLYHRFLKDNALADGSIELGDRTVSLADVTAPVLVFAGATDGIAPLPATRALVPLLTGAAEAQLEIVPGGHLGMLTGRGARESTWRALDAWLARWSGDRDDPAPSTPPSTLPTIGTRKKRRHGSGASRALSNGPAK